MDDVHYCQQVPQTRLSASTWAAQRLWHVVVAVKSVQEDRIKRLRALPDPFSNVCSGISCCHMEVRPALTIQLGACDAANAHDTQSSSCCRGHSGALASTWGSPWRL